MVVLVIVRQAVLVSNNMTLEITGATLTVDSVRFIQAVIEIQMLDFVKIVPVTKEQIQVPPSVWQLRVVVNMTL